MGAQRATRSQMLVELRRWLPNASLRKLGDMIDGAKLVVIEGQSESSTSLAFGLVLDGRLRVTAEGAETRWVGPGEIFGMIQYAMHRMDAPVLLTSTTNTVRYLAFSHDDVAKRGYARSDVRPL